MSSDKNVLIFEKYPSRETLHEIEESNPDIMIDLSACDEPIDDSWNEFSNLIYGAHIQIDCLDNMELYDSFKIPNAQILKISFTRSNPFSNDQKPHSNWNDFLQGHSFKKFIFQNTPSWEPEDIYTFVRIFADTRSEKTQIQIQKKNSRHLGKRKNNEIQSYFLEQFKNYPVFEII
ncbi:hypothetical protein SAMN05660337_2538 [Maridesulfovibrio ferrireducens]|uniref:Uncharacterized protein n=1 Tax=Maridesulfovibrio ferrireducens TaxID=246191 RepID=A0A1G9IDQ6_9BACT|nr:hypothetical protein [Maridesulfovibrio ferrireducens]SDL22973.1 hypothetical protein SAMN05660337_2538 [Maridesulfovibrio ferrireducens]